MSWHFEPSPFESDVFGVPVGRLAAHADVTPDELRKLIDDWHARGVWLVACRLPENTAAARMMLADAGFRPVETLLTLRRALDGRAELPAGVGPAAPDDHAATIEIAGSAFIYDRFHADPQAPNALADRLKAKWVENGLRGRSDAVLLARGSGAVEGFILCMRAGDDAVIDLIAVAPARRGRGVGRRLVAGALAHYQGRAPAMRVGTQADNAASLHLYEGMGFTVMTRQITFHWTNPAVSPKP